MSVIHWPFHHPNQFYPTRDSTGGPQDQTAAFQPDVGPPITRRRTTARVDAWSMAVQLETLEQYAEFEEWFDDTLQGGTLPFAWRHPVTGGVKRFQFAPASYAPSFGGGGWVRVAFSALILPGSVWFAPYVLPDTARPPDFVADYDGAVFGVGGVYGVASDLTGIAGTYRVWERRTDGTMTTALRDYASGVPTTAPSGVLSTVGFAE